MKRRAGISAAEGVASFSEAELRFIEAYVEHPSDGSRCALLAGVPVRTAPKQASMWLSDHKIVEEIERRLRAKQVFAGVTQAEVVRELSRIAFFDMRRLFNDDGTPKKVTELDCDTARSLAHFDVIQVIGRGKGEDDDSSSVEVQMKITPASKLKALELLAKHLGMLVDKKEISAGEGFSFTMNLGPKPKAKAPA